MENKPTVNSGRQRKLDEIADSFDFKINILTEKITLIDKHIEAANANDDSEMMHHLEHTFEITMDYLKELQVRKALLLEPNVCKINIEEILD